MDVGTVEGTPLLVSASFLMIVVGDASVEDNVGVKLVVLWVDARILIILLIVLVVGLNDDSSLLESPLRNLSAENLVG